MTQIYLTTLFLFGHASYGHDVDWRILTAIISFESIVVVWEEARLAVLNFYLSTMEYS